MRNAVSVGLAATAIVLCGVAAWRLLSDADSTHTGGGFGRGDAPATVSRTEAKDEGGRPVERSPFHDEPAETSADAPSGTESQPAVLSAITGRVTNESSSPLAGAVVELYATAAVGSFEDLDLSEFIRLCMTPLSPTATTVSGPEGAFAFRDVRPGAWFVVAAMDGRRTDTSRPVDVVKDAAAPHVALELGRALKQAGRVIDDGGAPVRASVSWIRQRTGFASGSIRREKTADAEGRFELTDLTDGPYVMFVRAEGFPPTLKQMSGTPVKDLEIVLARPAIIRGRVVNDADGTPLADVVISALILMTGEGGLARTTSLADGSFDMPTAPSGDGIALLATKKGFRTKAPPREDDESEIPDFGGETVHIGTLRPGQIFETTVRMSGGGVVGGRVVDADTGQGLDGVAVRLRHADLFSISGPRNERAVTDATGGFTISPVATGMFDVVAEKEGYFPETPPASDEEPIEETDEEQLVGWTSKPAR